jgi:polynucleotide 5'-kinase involved in rRNA processing
LHGKAKLIQLGTYPELSLSEAREQSREKRKQVKHEHIALYLKQSKLNTKKLKMLTIRLKKLQRIGWQLKSARSHQQHTSKLNRPLTLMFMV